MVVSFPSHIRPTMPFKRDDMRDGTHDIEDAADALAMSIATMTGTDKEAIYIPKCEHCGQISFVAVCVACVKTLDLGRTK